MAYARKVRRMASFSERQGVRPALKQLPDEDLPKWVRESVIQEVRKFALDSPQLYVPLQVYDWVRPYIWQVLNRDPPGNPQGGPWAYYIPSVFATCEWRMFYDLLEEFLALVREQRDAESAAGLADRISDILSKAGIAWIVSDGQVVRRLPIPLQAQIAQTVILLQDQKYKGPDEQFGKALNHLNRRPAPDNENCVKDAVGALEAMANILAGTTGSQLNHLLQQEPFKSSIHGTIRQAIDKVYAYRGAAPGAGHGLVGAPAVTTSDAQWVLGVAASTITYFEQRVGKN